MLLSHFISKLVPSIAVEKHKMQAALMFEVLMYLNSYYFGIFAIWEVITYVFKVCKRESAYKGKTTDIIIECSVFFFFCIAEICRIYIGRKSDTSDKPFFIIFSLILVIPSTACTLFFLKGQICTIRLEDMLIDFQLVILSCEVFFGLIHLCTYKADKYWLHFTRFLNSVTVKEQQRRLMHKILLPSKLAKVLYLALNEYYFCTSWNGVFSLRLTSTFKCGLLLKK